MRYLIIHNNEVFQTEWYDYENHWSSGMIVIDAGNDTYTVNGLIWMPIEADRL